MTQAAVSFDPELWQGRKSVLDRAGRPLRDLRISVTDRCNFRCGYCMPKHVFRSGFRFLPGDQLLSNDEIRRLSGVFVAAGVTKLRLTGGEPLLRGDIVELVSLLKELPVPDLALTTNGFKLEELVHDLKRAGLRRLTVSLDALDDALFRRLNDVDVGVAQIIRGIDLAVASDIQVKINAVIRRGVNEGQILPLARHFRGRGLPLRFIEFMDVGTSNGWQRSDVVSQAEILSALREEFSLEPLRPRYTGEVAERYAYSDGSGEVGIIASITQPFCGNCTRLRLSADGKLFTCLFATQGTDIRSALRSGASDDELRTSIEQVWRQRQDRYSELRVARPIQLRKIEMSYIGG